MKHKCRITVIRRPFFPDISVMSYGKEIGPCDFYEDGQVFIVDEDSYRRMLDGKFCGETWDCVKRYVHTTLHGGTMIGMDKYIACCNDACRPVELGMAHRID